jgi:nucleoside phosphorylase
MNSPELSGRYSLIAASPQIVRTLLNCAHFGEARSLLQSGHWQKHSESGCQYFEDDSGNLLVITGEGMWRALDATAYILGKYHAQIIRILNFGVAGTMAEALDIGQICHIRTSYCSPAPGHYEFRSFTSRESTSTIDCISSSQRLNDQNQIAFYRACAPLVDRELWGIAHAAHSAKIPFDAIKLVSDRVGTINCADVRSMAEDFSAALASEIVTLLNQWKSEFVSINTSQIFDFADIWKDAYFTHASRNRFNRLMRTLQLQLQSDTTHTIEYAQKIFSSSTSFKPKFTPKQRALTQIAILDQITSIGHERVGSGAMHT